MGDDALAKRLRGMRPARTASRPASMAFFMAEAINTGCCAPAMPVFMSTPSQPSSIATAASLAVPTPASTRIGTSAFSTIVRMLYGLRMPRPEPMGAASGITATQPMASKPLATMGSSLVYTITLKPSLIKISAAASVCPMLGRRIASVMISAPLASTARRASSRSLYLPVPTSRRDWYSRPARMSESRWGCAMTKNPDSSYEKRLYRRVGTKPNGAVERSPAADGADDLDAVAGAEQVLGVAAARHDFQVDLHRDALTAQAQLFHQLRDAVAFGHLAGLAVDENLHATKNPGKTSRRLFNHEARSCRDPALPRH